MTKGWLAGSFTYRPAPAAGDSEDAWERHASDPWSPEDANMVWPCAAISSNTVFSASVELFSGSQTPSDTVPT